MKSIPDIIADLKVDPTTPDAPRIKHRLETGFRYLQTLLDSKETTVQKLNFIGPVFMYLCNENKINVPCQVMIDEVRDLIDLMTIENANGITLLINDEMQQTVDADPEMPVLASALAALAGYIENQMPLMYPAE